ncbi:hypothetical protein V5P93_005483 [Actinokineospora auranticolor]|uniref:Lipoprotein n=1 Tax=Actinokineospora auranticolor TaxID=155976 RepID=A0A2S6GQL3_9PSEU|nr:hypothetical protein [Actinokineospora auranticolor]PPK67486.1 hypothetical protein CLV40_107150 [Actinokineospora auranticolor]
MKAKAVIRLLVVAFALLALSACGKADPQASGTAGGAGGTPGTPDPTAAPGAPLGAEFDLARGKTTTVSGTGAAPGVQITFREVTADSRCKPGQTCIWEGDATVVLNLAGSEVEVHTNKQFAVEAAAGGYRVKLAKLDVDGVVATLVVDRV